MKLLYPAFIRGFFPLFCATFLFDIYVNEVSWKKLRWQVITIFNIIYLDVNFLYHNPQTLQNSPDICLKPCGEVADSKQYQKIYLLQILFLLFHYKVFLFHNSCNQLKKKVKTWTTFLVQYLVNAGEKIKNKSVTGLF